MLLRPHTRRPYLVPLRFSHLAIAAACAISAACGAGSFGTSSAGSRGNGNGNGNGSTFPTTTAPGDPNEGATEDPLGGPPPISTNPNEAATNPNGGGNLAPGGMGELTGPAEVSKDGDGNYLVGPNFTPDPNLTGLQPGVEAGTWSTFHVPGANSNYYTGTAEGVNPSVTINRQVQVFVPSQYQAGTNAPLLVVMDGSDFQYTLNTTLPNLIESGALPPLVAVTVSAGSPAGTYNERSYEYDVVSTRWSDYVENEILPLVESNYKVKLTKNPALRGTLGGSSGGAAALSMGWLHPDRYTRLVTFSGSFVKLWPTTDYPEGHWFFANGGITKVDKKNLRISLQVSQNDINAGSGEDNDWLLANKNVAAALNAKGYHYRYTYVVGGGHEEAGALSQCIPSQLAWAWRGWQQSTP